MDLFEHSKDVSAEMVGFVAADEDIIHRPEVAEHKKHIEIKGVNKKLFLALWNRENIWREHIDEKIWIREDVMEDQTTRKLSIAVDQSAVVTFGTYACFLVTGAKRTGWKARHDDKRSRALGSQSVCLSVERLTPREVPVIPKSKPSSSGHKFPPPQK
jgi:hypothetical protein